MSLNVEPLILFDQFDGPSMVLSVLLVSRAKPYWGWRKIATLSSIRDLRRYVRCDPKVKLSRQNSVVRLQRCAVFHPAWPLNPAVRSGRLGPASHPATVASTVATSAVELVRNSFPELHINVWMFSDGQTQSPIFYNFYFWFLTVPAARSGRTGEGSNLSGSATARDFVFVHDDP